MDLFQLDPGSFQGWIFSAQMENCRIRAGSFSQAVLIEGHYNPDCFHIGFILSLGHSAMVQAHKYNDGTLTIHRNAIAMHEVFPADLAWVDIAIPEEIVPEKLPLFITEKIAGKSQLFLLGSRKSLAAIIRWVKSYIHSPDQPPSESQLQSIVTELLTTRLNYQEEKQEFKTGNRFKMHLLKVTHKLAWENPSNPLCLTEICNIIGMKPRTVQKYFHEIYGMGPTEYFRVRRLNRARTDLLQGNNNVSEVALQWGFSHLGRFAGRYKTHFGESPKDTQNQRKGKL
jgi:AraC-like DNA-binding protein